MTIQEARERGESLGGRRLDDKAFADVLEYTIRKSRMTGHDDDYIPLLLVDEIKDRIHRENQNTVSRELAAMRKEAQECVPSVSALHAGEDALMRKFPFMGRALAAEMILKLAAELSTSMETVIARIASMP